jgi:SAM-dependent methyltransferase
MDHDNIPMDSYDWTNEGPLYSRFFGWTRWAFLAAMGDGVLHYTPGGVLEIGCGVSTAYLTRLAMKYNRPIFHCDLQKSVIAWCTAEGRQFFKQDATIFAGASDDFFAKTDVPSLALSLIDGDHEHSQVLKDFENVLQRTAPNGFIFLHDTLPPNDQYLTVGQCHDAYKARQAIEKRDGVDCLTIPWASIGVGLTMVRKKPENLKPYQR